MTDARTTPSVTTTAPPARTMCVIVMLIPKNTCPQIGDSSTTQYIFFPQTNCRPGKPKATATWLCSHLSGSASGLVMTDARNTPSATTTAQPARTMCVIVILIPTNTCPQIGDSSTIQYIFFPQTNCRSGKSKAISTYLCCHLSGSASGLVMTVARTTPSVTTTAQGQSPTSRSKLGLPCHTTVDPAASASASCCKINPPSLHELQARFSESLFPFVGWCSLSNCHQARQRRCADGLSTTT